MYYYIIFVTVITRIHTVHLLHDKRYAAADCQTLINRLWLWDCLPGCYRLLSPRHLVTRPLLTLHMVNCPAQLGSRQP